MDTEFGINRNGMLILGREKSTAVSFDSSPIFYRVAFIFVCDCKHFPDFQLAKLTIPKFAQDKQYFEIRVPHLAGYRDFL